MVEAGARAETLRERLRRDTRDLHLAAEAALDPKARLADIGPYLDLLQRLWSLHDGMVAALEACPPLAGVDAIGVGRVRTAALASDIADLSGRPPARAPADFSFATAEEALGGIYVQLGSSLGGRVLFGMARDSLAIRSDHGGRFLAGGTEGVKAAWSDLVHLLSAAPARGAAADRAVGGARTVFTRFRDELA